MKYLHLYFSFILSLSLNAQTVFLTEDFETDGNGSRYILSHVFYDGDEDYFGRLQKNGNTITWSGDVAPLAGAAIDITNDYTNQNGNHFLAGEDLDDPQGDGLNEKTLLFSNININGSSDITVRFLIANGANSSCGATSARWDGEDGITVNYKIGTSPSFTEGICFNADIECDAPGDTGNEPLHHDVNCDGDGGDGAFISNTFTEYSFIVPVAPGDLVLDLQFSFIANAADEEFGIDFITLEALTPPLPVEFIGFKAGKTAQGVQLDWATATETDNDYFSIEHSIDGRTFSPIGQVIAKGNSDTRVDYQYIHTQPSKGNNFYRLRQVDFDGAYAYSSIQQLTYQSNLSGPKFSITPNPTNGIFKLFLANEVATQSMVSVFDLQGQLLQQSYINERATDLELDISHLPSGTYIVRLTSNEQASIRRLVKR